MTNFPSRPLWRWPLPLLVAWVGGWGMVLGASWLSVPAAGALFLGLLPSLWAQAFARPGWRRLAVVTGLPLSLLLSMGSNAVPPWAWLCAAALLLGMYPLQSWRDAPVFPTPRSALRGLGERLKLAQGVRVLDAGSGLGHAMGALRLALPDALIHGVENSWLLVLATRWRGWRGHFGRPHSWQVRQGDMWATSWAGYGLVYLFQRPESMQRAWRKAHTDMADGAWLVSLEFEVPHVKAWTHMTCPDGRALWIYRVNQATNSTPVPPGR